MMAQNWNIIWIVGRVGFLFSFFFYLMTNWTICDVWNYLCIAKAVYRNGMATLPSTLFSSSYFWFTSGHCKWVSEVPYPRGAEFRHTVITGAAGAGKSNVMIELLDQISDKNEKVVLVDTVGTYVQRYYQKELDIILNPLSENCVPWTFFNECSENENNEHLIKNVAECLVQSTGGDHDFWDKAARRNREISEAYLWLQLNEYGCR